MWAVQCNKLIIFTSFLLVLIVCSVLVSQPGEEGENYSQWLVEKVRGGWQGAGAGGQTNSSQLEQAGRRTASQILSDLHSNHCNLLSMSPDVES